MFNAKFPDFSLPGLLEWLTTECSESFIFLSTFSLTKVNKLAAILRKFGH